MTNHPRRSQKYDAIAALLETGIEYKDALALRRISMTLHRWHELECGVENGGVERDEVTGKVFWYNSYTDRRSPFRDRETGALKRLAGIMKRYPSLYSYVQSDPRGAALYILRPGDVPSGCAVDACYSRGVVVY
jgi:hypothetical protein